MASFCKFIYRTTLVFADSILINIFFKFNPNWSQ